MVLTSHFTTSNISKDNFSLEAYEDKAESIFFLSLLLQSYAFAYFNVYIARLTACLMRHW